MIDRATFLALSSVVERQVDSGRSGELSTKPKSGRLLELRVKRTRDILPEVV